MIPSSRHGRAVALACTLAAGTCCLAQDSFAASPDCSRVPEPNAAAETPASCKGLEACIRALIAAAEPGPGISSAGQAASKALLAFGDAAVPALLPLLKNESRDVRDLASYTLRDAPVREEHLDALIASRLKGDGWIAPAIARIGSPRAIEFLVSELRKEPENGTQLTWAFEVLGVKGVPYLVKLYDCSPQCDGKVLAVGAYIFSDLGGKAKDAIEPLLALAEDARQDRTGRRGAIQALGSIGPSAAPVVERLKAIAARDPEGFEESVTGAMIHIGGAAAIEGRQAEARAQDRCRTQGTSEVTRSRDALEALDKRIRALESADKGMVPTPPDSDEGRRTFGMSWNSGQTQLSWSWMTADGHVLAFGTLTWPSSYSVPEAHAADLLRIAELGLSAGCPPAKLPAFAPAALQAEISARDARPQDVAALKGELAMALREYASSAACVAPGR